MNWDILKIYPQEYIVQEEPIKMAKKKEPERGQEDMPF
jgi:hypothetical protein